MSGEGGSCKRALEIVTGTNVGSRSPWSVGSDVSSLTGTVVTEDRAEDEEDGQAVQSARKLAMLANYI